MATLPMISVCFYDANLNMLLYIGSEMESEAKAWDSLGIDSRFLVRRFKIHWTPITKIVEETL